MSLTTQPISTTSSVWQDSAWDAVFVTLALVQAVVLFVLPSIPVIAIGLWWNANTISHNFIHRPFFRSRILNRVFAVYLSLLLGFPYAAWRTRHLAHHAGIRAKIRPSGKLIVQALLVASLWVALAVTFTEFFVTIYLPGWVLGLVLCAIHGHYEHAGGTVSCYGRIYNLLFFKDGFHAEHHARPGVHWTRLRPADNAGNRSRWPPVLRWLELFSLESLERLVLRSNVLQRFVLRSHRRAFARLIKELPGVGNVGIVGGGLFPRTAIVLRELLPDVSLTVIDLSRESLEAASPLLPCEVTTVNEAFDRSRHCRFDLIVIPLSLQGDREGLYHSPPATFICIHDWIWRRRGESVVISPLLLKRLNLVRR